MTKLNLDGVQETMLWPLWNRACEAQRRDRLIDDPWSVNLVQAIDYDFEGNFGKPSRSHGIRARVGDDLVADFVERFGSRSCVVALGEGLETQYWRLGEPEIPWLSIDLPDALGARERLLPIGKSMALRPFSALNEKWMDEVPDGLVPFISAMGLFMYFEEAEVVGLLTRIAARFPFAEVFFDAIPPYISRKTLDGFNVTKDYRAPPMPWGVSVDDLPAFVGAIPSMQTLKVQTYADPFPSQMRLYRALQKVGPIRRRLAPSLVHAAVRRLS